MTQTAQGPSPPAGRAAYPRWISLRVPGPVVFVDKFCGVKWDIVGKSG